MGILGYPSQQVRLRPGEDVSDPAVLLERHAQRFLKPPPVELLNFLKPDS